MKDIQKELATSFKKLLLHIEEDLGNVAKADIRTCLEVIRLNDQKSSGARLSGMHHLTQLIEDYLGNKIAFTSINERHPKFFGSLEELLRTLPEREILPQSDKHFSSSSEDPFHMSILKLLKRNVFRVSRNVHKITGSQQAYQWTHLVNTRNLAIHFYQVTLIEKLVDLESRIQKSLCQCFLAVKDWQENHRDTSYDTDSLKQLIEEKDQSISLQIKTELDTISEFLSTNFETYYCKVNTIELSGRKFSIEKTKSHLALADQKWCTNFNAWQKTKRALLYEWQSDLKIIQLRTSIITQLEAFSSHSITKVHGILKPHILHIEELIEHIRSELAGLTGTDLVSSLKKVHYTSQKKLKTEFIPVLADQIASHELSKKINKLESSILQGVEKLPRTHFISKNSNYDQPLQKSDLTKVSNYELISFEILPGLQGQIDKIQENLSVAYQNAWEDTSNLSNIISYTLTSAITSLEEETYSREPISVTVKEGLDRAQTILDQLLHSLGEITQENTSQLKESVTAFGNELLALANADNIRSLNLRIKKAKAAKKAESYQKRFTTRLIMLKDQFFILGKNSINWLRKSANWLMELFFFTTPSSSLTKEVSDFLSESRTLINQLPVIYKRLYEINPVKDWELFIGRDQEIEELTKSYQEWQAGKLVSAIIIGEKWVGKTSFVNYAINQLATKCPVVTYTVKDNINTESELLKCFQSTFPDTSFNHFEDLIKVLNEGNQRIIILEDIQNAFLRKMNGFDALKALYVLINSTQKNVFWVLTVTKYAWNFLSKSVNLFEFFSYQIELGTLTNQQITDLIMKRNRISGYKVLFKTTSQKSRKGLEKLDKNIQQDQLGDQFFEDLNEFSKGNISLALRFWLLSTLSIDRSTIQIGSFKKPDLSFVSMIAMEKVFVLHALVLHDGLSVVQLSEVVNVPLTTCKLSLISLAKHGIVLKEGDTYSLNPLLYRNVVNLLRAKNLLH